MAASSAIAEDSPLAHADLARDLPADANARLLHQQLKAVPDGWIQVKHLTLLQMVAPKFDGTVLAGRALAWWLAQLRKPRLAKRLVRGIDALA